MVLLFATGCRRFVRPPPSLTLPTGTRRHCGRPVNLTTAEVKNGAIPPRPTHLHVVVMRHRGNFKFNDCSKQVDVIKFQCL
jgi:hypothetical protein